MTTLQEFGFTTKRRGGNYVVPSKVMLTDNTVAFIQPIEIPKRKILPKKSTITQYFSTVTVVEEPVCTIRKKLPILDMLEQIQSEYSIDEDCEANIRDYEQDNYIMKRQKTMDGLSYAMHRYLNIKQIQLRHKMTVKESNMFTVRMTQELL